MRKRTIFCLLLVLIGLTLAWPVHAQLKPQVTASVAAKTKYIWRGLALTDDPVLQPAVSVRYMTFGLDVWGNMDLGDVNDSEFEFSKADVALYYAIGAGPVGLDVGLKRYTFNNTGLNGTTEIFLRARAQTVLGPSAALSFYKDIDEGDGYYYTLAFGYSPPFAGALSALNLGLQLGWGSEDHNRFYYGAADPGAVDLQIGASRPIPLGSIFTLAPGVSYVTLLTDSIKQSVEDDSHFVLGVTLTGRI